MGRRVFQWLRSSQVEFGLNLLYALIGLSSLLAWLRDRKQWLLLCMAGYALTQVAATILGNLLIPWPFSITIGLLQPVLMIQDVSLWYLLLLLLKLDDNKRLVQLTRVWVIVFCLAFGLDGLTTALWGSGWPVTLQIIDAILTVIFTPLETLPILLVVAAVMQSAKRPPILHAGWSLILRYSRCGDALRSSLNATVLQFVADLAALDPQDEAECAALCLQRSTPLRRVFWSQCLPACSCRRSLCPLSLTRC